MLLKPRQAIIAAFLVFDVCRVSAQPLEPAATAATDSLSAAAKTSLVGTGLASMDLDARSFGPAAPASMRHAESRPASGADLAALSRPALSGPLSEPEVNIARLVSEAAAGSVNGVRKLLDAGVNPSGINSAGHSALAEAVRNDQAKVVRLLLERGANPNLITRSGHTPLTLAITRDRSDLIDLLLRAGASPNQPDATGMTPLERAISLNRQQSVEKLVQASQTDPGLIRRPVAPSPPASTR
jgi:hypothetical protein